MKKVLQKTILTLLIGNCIYSQDIKLGFKTGIGIYSMSGLKIINNAVPLTLPFDTKLVSNFPPYFYYQPAFLIRFANYSLGLVYSFQSTGSRISGNDYSGEYRFDMKVNSNNPGIHGEISIISRPKFQISLYSSFGVAFSNLKMNEYLNIQDSVLMNETYKFKALNYYFEPGINTTYTITSLLSVGINAGYFIQFGDQAFHLDGNKENKLIDPNNRKPVKPDWKGFRLGLSFFYNIYSKGK